MKQTRSRKEMVAEFRAEEFRKVHREQAAKRDKIDADNRRVTEQHASIDDIMSEARLIFGTLVEREKVELATALSDDDDDDCRDLKMTITADGRIISVFSNREEGARVRLYATTSPNMYGIEALPRTGYREVLTEWMCRLAGVLEARLLDTAQ